MTNRTDCERHPETGTYFRPNGWHMNGGSWCCPLCGWGVGSNLKGEKPFWEVARHRQECNGPLHDAIKRIRR